jgi:hypothetical protein
MAGAADSAASFLDKAWSCSRRAEAFVTVLAAGSASVRCWASLTAGILLGSATCWG